MTDPNRPAKPTVGEQNTWGPKVLDVMEFDEAKLDALGVSVDTLSTMSTAWADSMDCGGFVQCGDISPIDGNLWMVGTDVGGVRISYDAGRTWQTRNNGLDYTAGIKVAAVHFDRVKKSRIYCCGGQGTDVTSALYMSDDLGLNWTKLFGLTATGIVFLTDTPNNAATIGTADPRVAGQLIQTDPVTNPGTTYIYTGTCGDGVWTTAIDSTTGAVTAGPARLGLAGKYVTCIQSLATSWQKAAVGDVLIVATENITTPERMTKIKDASLGSGTATPVLLLTGPQNVQALAYVSGTKTTLSAVVAVSRTVAGTSAVQISSAVATTGTGASPAWVNMITAITGTVAPDTAAHWCAVDGYEDNTAGDQRFVVLIGCASPVADNAGFSSFRQMYRGVVDCTGGALGNTTWTRLVVHQFHRSINGDETRPYWQQPGSQITMPGIVNTCTVGQIRVNQKTAGQAMICSRGAPFKMTNSLANVPTAYVMGRGNGMPVSYGLVPHPTIADRWALPNLDWDMILGYGTDGRIVNPGFLDNYGAITGRLSSAAAFDPVTGTLYCAAGGSGTTNAANGLWRASTGGVGTAGTPFDAWDQYLNPAGTAWDDLGFYTTNGAAHAGAGAHRILKAVIMPCGSVLSHVCFTKQGGAWYSVNYGTTWTQFGAAQGIFGGTVSTNGEEDAAVDYANHRIFVLERRKGLWRVDVDPVTGIPLTPVLISKFTIPTGTFPSLGTGTGFVQIDPTTPNRVWYSTDTGLRFIDHADIAPFAATIVGSEVFTAQYPGQVCGPIRFESSGALYLATLGEAPSGTFLDPGRILRVTSPANTWSAADLTDDFYQGAMMHPTGMMVSCDDRYLRVAGQGTGPIAKRLR